MRLRSLKSGGPEAPWGGKICKEKNRPSQNPQSYACVSKKYQYNDDEEEEEEVEEEGEFDDDNNNIITVTITIIIR